jgi:hypothetical protein
MAASEDRQYRTLFGIVFTVEEGQVKGQTVRNLSVRQTGLSDAEAVLVRATVWPELEAVDVQSGDVVVLEGAYRRSAGTSRTFHNLSVSKMLVLGHAEGGSQTDRIPF